MTKIINSYLFYRGEKCMVQKFRLRRVFAYVHEVLCSKQYVDFDEL